MCTWAKIILLRESGNALFSQSNKWVPIISIWSIFNNSFKRCLLDYMMDMKRKKIYEFFTWPQYHRGELMVFLRNRSLFSIHLCRNLFLESFCLYVFLKCLKRLPYLPLFATNSNDLSHLEQKISWNLQSTF